MLVPQWLERSSFSLVYGVVCKSSSNIITLIGKKSQDFNLTSLIYLFFRLLRLCCTKDVGQFTQFCFSFFLKKIGTKGIYRAIIKVSKPNIRGKTIAYQLFSKKISAKDLQLLFSVLQVLFESERLLKTLITKR